MKATQYLAELRSMNQTDLDARLKEARTELFNLRFQAATGQLENHRQIRNVRRQIAQVLTVLEGRKLGFEEIVNLETLATRGTQAAPAIAAPAAAAPAAIAEADEGEAEQALPAAEVEAGDASEAAAPGDTETEE
jgi:large subunit ribosomal protein L29